METNHASNSGLSDPLWHPLLSYAKPDRASLPSLNHASAAQPGSYQHDLYNERFNMQWPSWNVFQLWMKHEEECHSIRFAKSNSDKGTRYLISISYVCNRQQTGGDHSYQKKHPKRIRKVETRKVSPDSLTLVYLNLTA